MSYKTLSEILTGTWVGDIQSGDTMYYGDVTIDISENKLTTTITPAGADKTPEITDYVITEVSGEIEDFVNYDEIKESVAPKIAFFCTKEPLKETPTIADINDSLNNPENLNFEKNYLGGIYSTITEDNSKIIIIWSPDKQLSSLLKRK